MKKPLLILICAAILLIAGGLGLTKAVSWFDRSATDAAPLEAKNRLQPLFPSEGDTYKVLTQKEPSGDSVSTDSELTGEQKRQTDNISRNQPSACSKISSSQSTGTFIRVSVATLWKEPGSNRKSDEPSLRNPVDIAGWLKGMSIPSKLWLVGKTETQALLGDKVAVLEERGEWTKVAVIGQNTPLNSQGYPGWLPTKQLAKGSGSGYDPMGSCGNAVVVKQTTWLYFEPQLSEPFMEISFNTALPVMEQVPGWFKVNTPDNGIKWLPAEDVHYYAKDDKPEAPSGQQVVEKAKTFLNLPYLWAGISGFGFDCSGFTYSLYRSYGISIPRDAKDQAVNGMKVDSKDLQSGDLLFYARDKGKGTVHHVAMYAGDGKMIHSPRTERTIEIIPMNTSEYASEFAGARRYLTN